MALLDGDAGKPAFPRIPHLVEPSVPTRDDLLLEPAECARLLTEYCIVEEKLDGANVSLWLDQEGRPTSGARSGPTPMDRAGQFGRLRAWIVEHAASLRELLGPEEVAYAEWLWRSHSTRYDALPDWLVILDLWSAQGFLGTDERDQRCGQHGFPTPPIIHRGVLGNLQTLERLQGRSRFGSEPAEGFVLRWEQDGRLVMRAKWLAPGFRRRTDQEWLGKLETNAVLPQWDPG